MPKVKTNSGAKKRSRVTGWEGSNDLRRTIATYWVENPMEEKLFQSGVVHVSDEHQIKVLNLA